MRKLILGSVVAALAGAVALPAASQQAAPWPTKPIKFVLPYQPGGIIDAAARNIAPKLTEAWGQQIIIENKPGGNAFIGMSFVAKSPPDGYTWVIATLGDFTANPIIFKDIPYSIEADFIPVTTLTAIPTLIAVNTESPYKSVADVIADAKAKPDKLSYSSSGNGSINHLYMEALALQTGVKFQHIPYKGGAPASTALAAGDVQLGSLAITGAIPFLRAGKIRMLATSTLQRLETNPEWPTMKELGMLDMDGSNWTGMLAPKGTPMAIVEKMNAELNKVLRDPEVKQRLATTGGQTIPVSVAEFAARIKNETEINRVIIEKAKIQPE